MPRIDRASRPVEGLRGAVAGGGGKPSLPLPAAVGPWWPLRGGEDIPLRQQARFAGHAASLETLRSSRTVARTARSAAGARAGLTPVIVLSKRLANSLTNVAVMRDVVAVFAQRRQRELDDVEAIVEVFLHLLATC